MSAFIINSADTKTGSLDNAIREFSLALPSRVKNHCTMLYKYGSKYLYFSLKFSRLCGVILIKQNHFPRLCCCLSTTSFPGLSPGTRLVYLPSHIKTPARGIIVDYVAEMVRDEKMTSDWFP